VTRLIESRTIVPCVHEVFDLEAIVQAHSAVELGTGVRGKVVIKVQ
jgi:NADPH:quinone reductase-like Zn-dependent oxidoreductase